MALEIEHKYLVINDDYKKMAERHVDIKQGYLNRSPHRTVRVRTVDDKGYFTVKGITIGGVREEYEYEIPYEDALNILKLAEPGIVEKTRYYIRFEDRVWEVDEFHGGLQGVVIAEVELNNPDQPYDRPSFIGKDITGNPDYYNSNLKV